MSVDLKSWASGQAEIFKAELAYLLMMIIIVIIIERYASRTDYKAEII